MWPQYSDSGDAVPYDRLVPLVEKFYDATTFQLGESPNGGTTDLISQLIGSGVCLIGSSPGLGGTSIANLSQGSASYARLITQAQRAALLVREAGGTFAVPAVTWLQGEADQGVTSRSGYVTALATLAAQLAADI